MNSFTHYLSGHATEDLLLLELLLAAFIATMPEQFPGFDFQAWWTWLRSGLQAFVASRNPHVSSSTTQQTHVGPAEAQQTTTISSKE